MRALLLVPTLALLTSVLSASQSADVFNRLLKVLDDKDEKGALLLLQDAKTITDFLFPGGEGPVDRNGLAIRILTRTRPFVPWDESSSSWSVGDPEIGRWIRANPSSATAMVEMLSSPSPVARWIAIEKLREANDVPASVVATLREVAERDDFIRLRSWEPGDDTETYRSNDPEAEGTVFVARLRNGARALLARMGVALGPLDEQQLGREGLRWLAQLYLAEGNTERDRMRVAGALAGLSPRTPEIARSKRRAWPSEEPARIRAFFEDLSNGRFPPVNGNAGSNRRSVEGGSAPAKAATAAKKAPTDVDKPSRQDSPREWGQLVGVLAIAVVAVVVLLGLRARQRARDDSKRDKV